MGPAAILSILVKTQGVKATTTELETLNASAKATAAGIKETEVASRRASGAYLKGAKAVAGFVGAYAAVATLKKSVEVTEEIGKTTLTLNRSFGLATKAASEWASVSQARGTEGKALTMGFKALATQTRNAASGSKQAVATFKELGISQGDLKKHGDDLDYILRRVSDGLGALPAGTEKAALQAKLFGRTWIALSPLVRDGSKALDEQLKTADKYGATLSGKGLSAIREHIKAEREQKLATIGLNLAIGQVLIPTLSKVTVAFTQFILGLRTGQGLGGKVANAVGTVVDALNPFLTSIKDIVTWITKQQVIVNTIIPALGALAIAIWAVNAAMEANPWVRAATLIGALVVAIVTAYRESDTFRAKFQSVVQTLQPIAQTLGQYLVAAFDAIKNAAPGALQVLITVGQAVVTGFNAVRGALGAAVNWVQTAMNNIKQEWQEWDVLRAVAIAAFAGIVAYLTPAFAAIVGAVKVGMALAANAFTTAWNVIKAIFTGAWTAVKAIVQGGLQVLSGLILVAGGILKGDFSQIWDGIKKIFSGSLKAIVGIFRGEVQTITGVAGAIGRGITGALTGGFQAALDAVVGFVNAIIKVINKIPGVNIGLIGASKVPTTPAGNPNIPASKLASGGAYGATGGFVNSPIVMMGEEAPRYPEFVIPTNPAYRGRAQWLLAQAASSIGFAKGGILGGLMDAVKGGVGAISKLLPSNPLKEPFTGLGTFLLGKAASFAKDKVGDLLSKAPTGSIGPGGAVGGGASPGGLVAQVLAALAWARAHGWHGTVTSGFRSYASQKYLWDNAPRLGLVRGVTVARPGTSEHESGRAVDVTDVPGFLRAMASAPPSAKLIWRGASDPVHFSVSGHRKGGIIGRFAGGGLIPGLGSAITGKGASKIDNYHNFWTYARTRLHGPVGRGTSPALWYLTLARYLGVPQASGSVWKHDKAWQPKWNKGQKYARGGILGRIRHAAVGMKWGTTGQMGKVTGPSKGVNYGITPNYVMQNGQLVVGSYTLGGASYPPAEVDTSGGGGADSSQVDELTKQISDLNDNISKLNDKLALQQRQLDDAHRAATVSQSQYAVLAKAIADIASGQIGGKVGLGFMTPRFPGGGGARY